VGVDGGVLTTRISRRSLGERPWPATIPADAAGRRIGEMAEAYCVKDKRKVEIKNPQQVTMKNGKPAVKGTCPICGGSVFRIGG
jgi:Domain of unknown function (DUF5679)